MFEFAILDREYRTPPSHWPDIAYAPMTGVSPVEIPAMDCCLGAEETPLAFIGHLVHVLRLTRPLLRPDGTVWLNPGDSYAQPSKWGGRSGNKNRPSDLGRYPRRRLRADSGLKDKDLYGMPWRLALALQADGWYLRTDVVWEKPSGMCESAFDRPTRIHEYVFLLSRSQSYYYDAAAIDEPAVATKNRGGGKKLQDLVAGAGEKNDGFKERWQPNGRRNRRSVWHQPAVESAVSAVVERLHAAGVAPELLARPPCFLDEPYQITHVISYCDTRRHRGTIYRAAGFEQVRVNKDGIATFVKPTPLLSCADDLRIRELAEQSPRSQRYRAERQVSQLLLGI
jgi:hypothetical protein